MNKASLPPALFAHANGFPGGCYLPLIEALEPLRVDCINSISEDVQEVTPRLKPLVSRLIDFIEGQGYREPIIGLGHSLGAILMFFASKRRPELFRHVILMDPPFFIPPKRLLVGSLGKLGLGNLVPVARLAARRRRDFPNRAEALTYFKTRPLFQRFHPATAMHFVEHGLVEHGDSLTLRIPPEFERAVYLNLPVRLGSKRMPVPASFLFGTQHDVLSQRDIRWLKRRFYNTAFFPVNGSHMFPLEVPEIVGKTLKAVLNIPE